MSAIAVNLRDALQALLDATEPPAPLSIEDFITGTTDGEVDTDEFFADLDERPAEPPVIQYAESATVAGLAEKIAGENAELMERLAAKPAEDEREALVMSLYANDMAGNLHEPIRRQAVEKWADAILAAGYRKGPRPITDGMVEAAAASRAQDARGRVSRRHHQRKE